MATEEVTPPVYDQTLPTLYMRHEAQLTDMEANAQRYADNTGQRQQILRVVTLKPGPVLDGVVFIPVGDDEGVEAWVVHAHIDPNPTRQEAGR